MLGFFSEHKILSGILGVVLALIVLVGGIFVSRIWGVYRSYRVDFVMPAPDDNGVVGQLQVGVAKRDITPDLMQYDSWVDANGDNHYDEDKGDHYIDENGNGQMDLVWMGGFSNNRPAKGVNDPLWTRAIAVQNNGVTLAMVTIDAVGITHDRFIHMRKLLEQEGVDVDHVMFSSTHTHNSPDTIGMWSYKLFPSLFDEGYMELIAESTVAAVKEAVEGLQPADMILAQRDVEPEKFVRDSREPLVWDRLLCIAQFVKAGTDDTIATMVSWGNHPEALGGDNPYLSSDFAHYWREGVENGLRGKDDVPDMEGLGGMCLYFQGPVGGLMTPLRVAVPDRFGEEFKEESVEKTVALGEKMAAYTLETLADENLERQSQAKVAAAAKTVFVTMDGLTGAASMLGLIHPGWYWGKGRSELNAISVGDLQIVTSPGEIYPEIVDGGVEAPEGQDFNIAPVEVPPARGCMTGKVNMYINLANDEIGYIVPQSQWDEQAPFTYGRDSAPYGEQYGAPDWAPTLHNATLELIDRLHGAL
jgi:hypothetical protein